MYREMFTLFFYRAHTMPGEAAPGIFIWGYSPGGLRVWGTEVPHGVQERSRGIGVQLPDIVYRFWRQKRSIFENFTQYIHPDS